MRNIEMTISMKCSICGNDQFSAVDEDIENIENADNETKVKCSDCGIITTKEQLIEENRYIIDANIENFKDKVKKQWVKKFKKMFK